MPPRRDLDGGGESGTSAGIWAPGTADSFADRPVTTRARVRSRMMPQIPAKLPASSGSRATPPRVGRRGIVPLTAHLPGDTTDRSTSENAGV